MAINRATRARPEPNPRKAKYQGDPAYRERAKDQSRKAYQRQRGIELDTCLHSLGFLDQVAKKQQVCLSDGTPKTLQVLSIAETASMLQRIYSTVWRWVATGVIPAPVLTREQWPNQVYHVDEVRILVEEIGNHEKLVTYFRKDHLQVRKRIEQRFAEIRKKLNIV